MDVRLYVIRGSHACRTGILMLEHKGVDYRLVTIPTGLHPVATRILGFSAARRERRTVDRKAPLLGLLNRLGTVPALRAGNARIQTNHAIARFLDGYSPERPLLPADPGRRRPVEEIERWGDETLQMLARRLVLAYLSHDPESLIARGGVGRLGPLLATNAGVPRCRRSVRRSYDVRRRARGTQALGHPAP